MLNQTTQPSQRTRLWFLSPGCLIDKLLDYIEELSSFVLLPAKIDNPPCRVEIKVRPERFGA
jgi:hypothetical protein